MNEKVRERSEISDEFKWAVNDIYSDDSCWRKDYDYVKNAAAKLESYKGRLSASSEIMLEYFKLNDDIGIRFDSLVNYAHRRRDEDNRNPVYQEMCGQLSALISEISDAGSFEVPEILSISSETLEKFFDENEELRLYKLYVSRLQKRKESLEKKSMGFMMSEWDEKLLKYGHLFETKLMDLSVNIPLEEALDLGWGILAECFEPNETGLKTSLLQERWPKKDALN